jgi:hypothetical protein
LSTPDKSATASTVEQQIEVQRVSLTARSSSPGTADICPPRISRTAARDLKINDRTSRRVGMNTDRMSLEENFRILGSAGLTEWREKKEDEPRNEKVSSVNSGRC